MRRDLHLLVAGVVCSVLGMLCIGFVGSEQTSMYFAYRVFTKQLVSKCAGRQGVRRALHELSASMECIIFCVFYSAGLTYFL